MIWKSHDRDIRRVTKKNPKQQNRSDTKKNILLLLKKIVSLKLNIRIKMCNKTDRVYLNPTRSMFFRNIEIKIEFHTRSCSAQWQLNRDVVQTVLLKGLMEKHSSWNRTKRGILHVWLPALLLLLSYVPWNQLKKLHALDYYRLWNWKKKLYLCLSVPQYHTCRLLHGCAVSIKLSGFTLLLKSIFHPFILKKRYFNWSLSCFQC